jgi:glycosyltransferase involved in cell wall biosynthesis
MHLGIFYRDFLADGGAPKEWRRLASELTSVGSKVTVYTYTGAQPTIEIDDVSLKIVKGNKRPSLWVPTDLLAMITDEIYRPDVLIVVGALIPENIAVCRAASRSRIPYVLAPIGHLALNVLDRSPIRKRLFLNLFLRPIFRRAAGIHYLSDFELEQLRKYSNGPFIKLGYGTFRDDIPAKLSGKYFRKRLGLSNENKVIMYLGRLDIYGKGLDVLIGGFSLALPRLPGAVLLLVGPDETGSRQNLHSLIRTQHLEDHVKILDPIYGDEKFDALASADVLVLTSRYDAFPRSIREGLSVGCPCIVSEETMMGSVLIGSGAGEICDVSQTDLAQCLVKLLRNVEKLKEMRQNARLLSSSNALDWTSIARTMQDGYREILKQFRVTASE